MRTVKLRLHGTGWHKSPLNFVGWQLSPSPGWSFSDSLSVSFFYHPSCVHAKDKRTPSRKPGKEKGWHQHPAHKRCSVHICWVNGCTGRAGHDVDFDGCWCSHYPGSSLRSSQSLSLKESLALKETILVSPGPSLSFKTPSIHWWMLGAFWESKCLPSMDHFFFLH